MPVDRKQALRRLCWGVFTTLLFAGSADCDLSLAVQSPPMVIAKAGSNVILNVSFAGAQNPLIQWSAGALPIVTWVVSPNTLDIAPNYAGVVSLMPNGSLVFSNVQKNYSDTYTVSVTKSGFLSMTASITLLVFAPPVCSVQSANTNLNYTCQTPGDTISILSISQLNKTFSTSGSLSLVVPPAQNLSGMAISCIANQINITQSCSVTAQAPQGVAPTVSSTLSNGNLVVTITCAIGSVPAANIIWFKGSQVLSNGGPYQISSDTTQLNITRLNLTVSDLSNYTCKLSNPFGPLQNSIQLIGPTISDSSLISNTAGTMVTLTWDVPSTSVFTGFNIQMEGPALQPSNGTNQRRKRDTGGFQTIAVMPSSARSKQISGLDPKSNYWFWIVPLAGSVTGPPSQNYSVGPVPGQGLSKAAILGLAIGIPCGFLLLLIIIALIILCVVCCRRRRRQQTYPPPGASEKVVTGQTNLNTPHNLLTGGIQNGSPVKNPKGIPERQFPHPSTGTIPPPLPSLSPMRLATTV
nr:V-set and immunoglobulin domain-containing protein 10-like isoform X1 [Paramormyrops kingsleyae]